MSVDTMLYSDLKSGSQYINICRDLSWYNSKNMEHSDRDGNVYTYICNVKIHGSVKNSISLGTAPNSWKMRNAFRKWHAYRDMMFKDAGVTESEKGRYGKTIRPYLDTGMHTAADVRTPAGWDVSGTPPVQTQEWTYTEIAAAPGFDAAAVGTEGEAAVDVYELNICGPNVASATTTLGTEYYSEVGMIHSYNQDRQEVPLLDLEPSDTFVSGHNNPLALLRYKGTAGGEVMDIVEDQEREAPPYDITDDGASLLVNTGDIMQINPGYDGSNSVPVIRTSRVMVHGGILKLYTTAADTDASILIEVVGRVLSKDLA